MKKKSTSLIIISLIMNLLLIYYYANHDSIIDSKLKIKNALRLGEESNPWVLDIIKDIKTKKKASDSEVFDRVRNYIFNYSIHKEGTDYHLNRSFATDSVLKDIYKLKHKQSSFIPEMSCSPRAWAMRRILKAMSFETRILMFYKFRNNKIFSHTVLEVKNKENNRWELHDPDVNLYFIDSTSNERLSFMSMKDMDSTIYVPCREDSCDWNLTYYSLKDKSLFATIFIHYLNEDYKKGKAFIDSKYYTSEEIKILEKHFSKIKNILYY